jgi:hypothetical protein
MSAPPRRPAGPQRQGQAMVEYLVVTAVVAAAMFVPTPLTNDMSAADYLARAVRSFFRAYSFILSVT